MFFISSFIEFVSKLGGVKHNDYLFKPNIFIDIKKYTLNIRLNIVFKEIT